MGSLDDGAVAACIDLGFQGYQCVTLLLQSAYRIGVGQDSQDSQDQLVV